MVRKRLIDKVRMERSLSDYRHRQNRIRKTDAVGCLLLTNYSSEN